MCHVSVLGFLLLMVAFLACGVGFIAPYWVYFAKDSLWKQALQSAMGQSTIEHDGPLGRCFHEKGCKWFWMDDFAMEKTLEDMHITTQALYSFGYVFILSALLLSILHLCCQCCCRRTVSLSTIIGCLLIAGAVLVAAAIAVFAAFQYSSRGVRLEGGSGQFNWACFVATSGVAASILAAILFICDGCRSVSGHDGYETARTI